MAKNQKLKSKPGSGKTKVVDDTTQRKLSFYLKKNGSKTTSSISVKEYTELKPTENEQKVGSKVSVTSTSCFFKELPHSPDRTSRNLMSSADSEIAIICTSPLVNEIPPTPPNPTVNVSALSKSRVGLFFHNGNGKVPFEKIKRKSDVSSISNVKRFKLSRKKQAILTSPNAEVEIAKSLPHTDKSNTSHTKLLGKRNEAFSFKSDLASITPEENSTEKPKSLVPDRTKENATNRYEASSSKTEIISAEKSDEVAQSRFLLDSNKENSKNIFQASSSKTEIVSAEKLNEVAQSRFLLNSDKENSKNSDLDKSSFSKCDNSLLKTSKKEDGIQFDATSSSIMPCQRSPTELYTVLKTPTKNSKKFETETVEGNDWEEDLDLISELSRFSTPKKSSTDVVPKANTQVFTVTSVERRNDGLFLTLQSLHDAYTRHCLLKEFWCDTLVETGDSVTVISEFDNTGFSVINNNKGFLTVNNNILVSSTAITSTMFCSRKTVLAEKFYGWDSGNQAMLLGNIIHEFFQHVAQSEPKSVEELRVEFKQMLKSTLYLHELYGLGLTEVAIESQALPYLSSIHSWNKQYHSINPSPLCQDTKDQSEEILAQVVTVQDIEDNIWCSKYGIKGKVDLTVGVKLHKRNMKRNKVMPLELKTGKSSFSIEHQGQVILYSMMMSDRLEDPGGGLLLYLSEGPKMKFIETNHNKERDLIMLRNKLAYYFKYLNFKCEKMIVLPEAISRFNVCQKCPFLLPCSLMDKESEHQNLGKERSKLVDQATRHLSSDHISYFFKWYTMLQHEFKSQYQKQGVAFWLETGSTREKKGICLSDLQLDYSTVIQVDKKFIHTFYKKSSSALPSDTSISVGDYVIISSIIKPEFNITAGTITSITLSSLTVLLDKNLSKRDTSKKELYRLDLNYSVTAFSTSFKNLLKLMQNTSEAERLRTSVIDLAEPTFKKGLRKDLAVKLKPFLKVLNVAQQRAVLKLLMAESHILIHGMPGTGKTATIVSLVQVLVALGFSVLLTSYTHSAVDNILLRLYKRDVHFVRLGQSNKIHPEIRQYSSEHLTKDKKSVGELKNFYSSVPVVATTSLSLNHSLFKQRTFDYCIVDEASQVLQTACLGPLFHSKVFVLVGDSKQLPPVVNNKEAKQMGLVESLFKRLESPSCTFDLNIQYRMNSEIMRLCNELTYDGKMTSGSEEVAKATLQLNVVPKALSYEWYLKAFSTDLSNSVLFLDTDSIDSLEVSDSVSVYNPTEVEIISYIANEFVNAGMSSNNIGVISFYRKQVQLLGQKFGDVNVEVNTVDQYQGRDKIIVIISCVRNSVQLVASEILMDERRLNVALTRAKHKLIIVGSRRTMTNFTPFEKLFKCLRSDQVVAVKTLPSSVQ